MVTSSSALCRTAMPADGRQQRRADRAGLEVRQVELGRHGEQARLSQ